MLSAGPEPCLIHAPIFGEPYPIVTIEIVGIERRVKDGKILFIVQSKSGIGINYLVIEVRMTYNQVLARHPKILEDYLSITEDSI